MRQAPPPCVEPVEQFDISLDPRLSGFAERLKFAALWRVRVHRLQSRGHWPDLALGFPEVMSSGILRFDHVGFS
ncbi:hypothetical protein ASF53_19620 [Methylobacterium sp. Leaf123]|nr:hypothetical protein ASF53_19620 [Methylobacterium sp. Leaf123]